MKKLFFLLSVVMLAACGGGGSGDGSSKNQVSQPGGSTATLALTLPKSTAKTSTAFDAYSGMTSTTWRRVIVTNPSIVNSAGKMVQFTYPDHVAGSVTSISIPDIPVASGYNLEIIDFQKKVDVYRSYSAAGTPVFRRYSVSNRADVIAYGVYPNRVPVFDYPPATLVPRTAYALTPFQIIGYYGEKFEMTAGGYGKSITTIPGPQAALSPAVLFHGGIPSSSNTSYKNLSSQYKMKVKLPGLNPFNTSNWTLRQAYPGVGIANLGSGNITKVAGFTNISTPTTGILIGPSAYDANNNYQNTYNSIADFNLKESLLLAGENSADFYYTSSLLPSSLYTNRAGFGP